MNGRAFVDTNVLVYAVDRDEPVKQARAQRLLDEAEPAVLLTEDLADGATYGLVTVDNPFRNRAT